MKQKIFAILSTAVLLSGSAISIASAEVGAVNVNANVNASATAHGNATSTAAKDSRGNATSTAASENRGNATSTGVQAKHNDNATSTNAGGNGQLTAAAHRSAVATFVQSLLNVANREGGIGAQVRVIAKAQNDAASSSAEAIIKVENRSKLQSFLFGSDYKALGTLRSEIVTTQTNIDQLKNLLDKVTNDSDKAELSAQIKVLEDSQVKLDAFVKAHESSLSLLGWFTKMFSK